MGNDVQLTACRFDDPAAQHLLHELYAEQLATYGLGVGWAILRELEQVAVARGLKQMILETGSLNTAAIQLYSRAGYRPIPSYVQGRQEINRAFSKHL